MRWVSHINFISTHYIYIIHCKSDIKRIKEKSNKEAEKPSLKVRPICVCACVCWNCSGTHDHTEIVLIFYEARLYVVLSMCLACLCVFMCALAHLYLSICPVPQRPDDSAGCLSACQTWCKASALTGPVGGHIPAWQSSRLKHLSPPPALHSRLPLSPLAVPLFSAYCQVD